MRTHLETRTTDCALEWSKRLGISKRSFFIYLDELREEYSIKGLEIVYYLSCRQYLVSKMKESSIVRNSKKKYLIVEKNINFEK
jgi:hypothetical protein